MKVDIKKLLARAEWTTQGCLVWTGPTQNGYALHKKGSLTRFVHRLVVESARGPIPKGHQVDHLCRNRGCINIDHLEAVTQAENNRRSNSPTGLNARKTECPRGHPYDYIDPRGNRQCKTCRAAAARRRRNRALGAVKA